MPSRRDLLGALAGSAALSGTAGCLASGASDPILNCVTVTDDAPVEQTVHLTVEFAGERVAWESITLAGNGRDDADPLARRYVERTWPAEPGAFTVRGRVDDRDEWDSLDASELTDGNYIRTDFRIHDDGSTSFWINSVHRPTGQCDRAPVATEASSGTASPFG